MLVLAIDTSTNVGTAGLYSSETGLVGEITINIKRTHSENIMTAIDSLLKLTEKNIQDIDKIAVSIGPGSFTGIRIGVAAAKGLAYSMGKPIAAVNELDATAFGAAETDCEIIPIIDARKERGYYCCYKYENGKIIRTEEYGVGEIREYLENKKDKKVLFLGDGAIKYSALIKEIMGDNAKFAMKSLSLPRAAVIAEMAVDTEDNLYTLEPFYLSKAQAEREKEAREQEKQTTEI